MKIQINMTDSWCDLDRFTSQQDLYKLLEGFDGLELMHMEDDPRHLINKDMITGYHFVMPECWMDFYMQDDQRLEKEYDSLKKAYDYYGGSDPGLLSERLRKEYEYACRCGALYMVVHVSDAGAFEEITGRYHYCDKEVIGCFCQMINAALPDPGDLPDDSNCPYVLLENMWQPGLNFKDPDITAMLMEGVRYPKKGIMLDTGHLMHTDISIKSQEEGLEYINKRLDAHGDLCRYIKGIHLNQSVTGHVMRKYMDDPPSPAGTFEERSGQLFTYIFSMDLHRPFTCPGVDDLIKRINPEFLTFEFISNDLEEHRKMLAAQKSALRLN